MEVEVEIPPFSKVAVSIKMTQKKTQLKYTATQCTLFVDGTKKCAPTEGYRLNISSESAVVDYGRFQDGSKYCPHSILFHFQGSKTVKQNWEMKQNWVGWNKIEKSGFYGLFLLFKV